MKNPSEAGGEIKKAFPGPFRLDLRKFERKSRLSPLLKITSKSRRLLIAVHIMWHYVTLWHHVTLRDMRHWCAHHWWWASSWCSKCNYQIVSTSALTIKYSVSSPPQCFFSPVLELVFLGFFCVWLWMGKAQPSKRHCWKRVEASVRTIGGVVMFWPRIVVQTWGPGSPSVVRPPAWNNTLETGTNT